MYFARFGQMFNDLQKQVQFLSEKEGRSPALPPKEQPVPPFWLLWPQIKHFKLFYT